MAETVSPSPNGLVGQEVRNRKWARRLISCEHLRLVVVVQSEHAEWRMWKDLLTYLICGVLVVGARRPLSFEW